MDNMSLAASKSSSKRLRQQEDDRPAKRLKPASSEEDRVSSLENDSESSSSSDSGSDREASSKYDAEDDKQAMLAALEAHGRAMFASLDSPLAGPSKSSAKPVKGKANSHPSGSSSISARPEMHGFEEILSGESEEDSEFEEGEGFDEDDGDDGLRRGVDALPSSKAEDEAEVVVSTVVFGGDSSRPKTTANTKADFKRFMSSKSSKMMNIKKADEDVPGRRKKPSSDDEAADEEDRSNAVLDKELQGLLLNGLLPGSLTAAKPSEKKNQMSSRLLELASIAGLGEGTSTLHSTAYKSQPTKIRSNILKAQERRSEKARSEAQAAGSWVKGSGGLGDIGGSGKDRGLSLAAKKRQEKERERRSKTDERGLGMGVGRFKGGVLTLSKSEIAKGSAVPEKFSIDKKGKGKKKGGGRK